MRLSPLPPKRFCLTERGSETKHNVVATTWANVYILIKKLLVFRMLANDIVHA